MYRTTISGKRLINASTRTPLYKIPVELRIKNVERELYQGMTRNEITWHRIQNSVKKH
jgi:hypothetical protein